MQFPHVIGAGSVNCAACSLYVVAAPHFFAV